MTAEAEIQRRHDEAEAYVLAAQLHRGAAESFVALRERQAEADRLHHLAPQDFTD